MGQQCSTTHLKIPDLSAIGNDQLLADDRIEDIHLFLPLDIVQSITRNAMELPVTKKIRTDLSLLTTSSGIDQWNSEMVAIIQQVFDDLTQTNTNLESARQAIVDKEQQLKNSYLQKSNADRSVVNSILTRSSSSSTAATQAEQLSFFAIQSFISMFLMLLRSIQRTDPTIVHEMLVLTHQLIEQIPTNYLSIEVYQQSTTLFRSLKPLMTYLHDLSSQTSVDPVAANQSMQILLTLAVIKASLKDILPLLRNLLFNTTEVYDLRKVFIELNKDLTTTTADEQQKDAKVIEYLKSIETLNDKDFTGQFVSSILLIHIDRHHQRHAKDQFERGSLDGTFSFEFSPETFEYLFEIIERLINEPSNTSFQSNLLICLRLFTTHLKFLMATNPDNIDEFARHEHVNKWFDTVLKLALEHPSEEIRQEASKAMLHLIERQTTSFFEMLASMHRYLIENKYPILVEQCLDKLTTYAFIQKWIEASMNITAQDHTLAHSILHSLVELVLKPNNMEAKQTQEIREIIVRFQGLILVHLNNQPVDVLDELESSTLSTLCIEHMTHIIKSCLEDGISSDLLERVLLGLSVLTEAKFNFAIVQPIFAAIFPRLAEYLTRTTTSTTDEHVKNRYLISWLLGKMIYRLIIGPPQSPLEKKYSVQLKLPIFAGGYEMNHAESNPYLLNLFQSELTAYSKLTIPYRRQESMLDSDFLLSIYKNIDAGAQLITKMKHFTRDKQRMLQKSIESYSNDACAALFAVYIKHYRRVDLARHELSQPIEQKPHTKLLSLYEYANQVQNVFATTKARGGDCQELHRQIKSDALLFLVSIKESSFISTVKEDFPVAITLPTNKFRMQRQMSRWTKAKYILRLLRNVLRVCLRLKKLMLERKKAIEQKKDSESVLHRAIVSCIYGNYLSTTDEIKIVSDDIVKCLIRQYQRAITRGITYQCCSRLMKQLTSMQNNEQTLSILAWCLTNLKEKNVDWHYLEHIPATNHQQKEAIGQQYYNIVHQLLSFATEDTMKPIFIDRVFDLLDLSYGSLDFGHFHQFKFEPLIRFFRSDSNDSVPMRIKLLAFTWFRQFVLKLCEKMELEQLRTTHFGSRKFHHIFQQQHEMIFHQIIFKELQQWQESTNLSLKTNFDLSSNQYLMLLLRCLHMYEHVRLTCATIDYVQLLLDIYHQNKHLNTRLLILKILRELMVMIPEEKNDSSHRLFMEKFLNTTLSSIGQYLNLPETIEIDLDLIIELIYIYRTLLTHDSPWQKMATQLIIDAIQKPISDNMEKQTLNLLLASLCVLGGVIRPFCLGSTVAVYAADRSISELETATIIDVDHNALESESSDVKPYTIQYAVNNNTESVASNQLKNVTDVLPPNLLLLPVENATDTILDTLGSLAQIDTSNSPSLILLQIKRRAIAALYPLLNHKPLVEIFMQKPYAPVIAQLSVTVRHDNLPKELRWFNRLHLEQYCLSLDQCERKQHIVDDEPPPLSDSKRWNQTKIQRDPVILQYLSTVSSNTNDWKPIVSKREMRSFQQNRTGGDEIRIIPLPANDLLSPLEECGQKHLFKGRVNLTDDTSTIRYPTYIVDDLQLGEGKWYYCVRLPLGGCTQIGWATKGFTPVPENSRGVGEDERSWAYDGSKGVCFYVTTSSFRDEIRWKEDDVCGCGIEVDGENTAMKFWLNGDLLGTAFSHSENNSIDSTVKTNLLPHGISTTYFPAVTIQVYGNVANTGVFEFIFNPEDMTHCPLPPGYKPLYPPATLHMDNVLVAYPYSAYLIGNDREQHVFSHRNAPDNVFIRDFVHHRHLLKSSEEGEGFLLPLENSPSFTISFEFDMDENVGELDVILFALDEEMYSIRISPSASDDDFFDENKKHRQRVAILFQNNQQTRVYINSQDHTLNYCHQCDEKTKPTLNLRLLPFQNIAMEHLGVWKYVLSEEHIRRLFTYGLAHVAADYRDLDEYRKQANSIVFKSDQNYFSDPALLPFNEPFADDLWQQRKKHVDHDESIYLKPLADTSRSTIALFGNKTYFVLDTDNQQWSEYTLVLDLLVPALPTTPEEQLTIMTVDTQAEIYITHDGHLAMSKELQASSIIPLQEYIRLIIAVGRQSVCLYINGALELNAKINQDQFATKLKRIDLFRGNDLSKNTTQDDQLRLECRSVTYTRQSVPSKSIKSVESDLDYLVVPSFDIVSRSLLGIGYAEESIKTAMKQYNINDIQQLDTILREQSAELQQAFIQQQQQRRVHVLARLTPYDQSGTLPMLMKTDGLTLSSWSEDEDYIVSEQPWYREAVLQVGVKLPLIEWIRDKSKKNSSKTEGPSKKLEDLAHGESDDVQMNQRDISKVQHKSLHYFHRQLPRKTYLQSRTSCELALTTIYARYTVLNMLKVWSNDDHPSLFPLAQFGEGAFIITLLKLMDFHHTFTRTHADDSINRMRVLTVSILKLELKELLKFQAHDQITKEIRKTKAPLFYQLQKHLMDESIRFLVEPSLIDSNNHDDDDNGTWIDEQILIKHYTFDFLLKIVQLFSDLLTHEEMKKYDVDLLIQLLFPNVLIKILFDLFLLAPFHRSKILILQLLAMLTRTSSNFHLPKDVQHFFLQLFIECLTNKIYRENSGLQQFRIALLDLIFALLARDKQLILTLNECPSDIRDLAAVLDVIDIVLNKSKETPWPESFFTQSSTILGETLALTKENVELAQVHFNALTDKQLMQFLNQHINLDWKPLPHEEINKFIEQLPTASVPDSTKYSAYTCLCDIPAIHIQTWAKVIYLFNILLGKILTVIDFSRSGNNSELTHQVRAARHHILHTAKQELFQDTLTNTYNSSNWSQQDVRFDTVKASVGEQPEDTMFYQAYQQLYANAARLFRRSINDQIWSAIFVGMYSTDRGGPYRDSITRICDDLLSPRLSLFIICPNGRTNSGLNRDRWIPNVFPPNRPIPDDVKNQYRFVGQLMGMAIRTRNLLDLKFPTLLWKQLVQEPVTIEDIEAIDMQSFTIINQMEENLQQVNSIENSEDERDFLFSSIMSELTFDVVSSAGQTHELIPGGSQVPITAGNFENYCLLYRDYRLHEFDRQVQCIREGLYSIVPSTYLTLFTPKELEEAVCGKGEIDIAMLKRNTSYNNDSETTPYIQRFWTVLSEMFSEEQKKLFLIFVWGRSTLPNRDEEFTTKFVITRLDPSGNVDEALPRSHTCFFTVDLPPYSTKEVMYERLNYAITYCSSIDGDGTMN